MNGRVNENVAERHNRKIVKYRKPFHVNIGILIFIMIFFYFMYFVYTYFTTEHISAYEVKQGTIAKNSTFEGLILRDEKVYYAENGGYINYYLKDGSKANAGGYIYSVDETGSFYKQMSAVSDGTATLTPEAYEQLDRVVDQYLTGYSDQNFRQVYQFRYDLEGTLLEALNINARDALGEAALAENAGLHVGRAETPGVVVFYTDGLENVTVDNFTAEYFHTADYEKDSFLKRETVNAGDAVYKQIQSESWQVVVPIDDMLAAQLAEEANLQVEFRKDRTKAWANSSVISRDGAPYLVLKFSNSMIRFVQDRYIEMKLLLMDTTGLKIPNTAIVEKEFITIPKEFITKGGDSNNDGVMLVQRDKNNEEVIIFTDVSLFYETEDLYYIDAANINLGDVVLKPDSNERYSLRDTDVLEGVYNINRGYAVFKRIVPLFENEEYTIVESGTSYGIAMYDHIALDGSAVQENDIIH